MATPQAKFKVSATDDTKRAFSSVNRGLSGVKNAVAGLGLALAVVGFGRMIKGAIDSADEIAKLSKATGLSVERLSALSHAAGLAGGDLKSIEKSSKQLSIALLEAGRGSKTYLDLFKALGVEAVNTDGTLRDVDDVLVDIADSFVGMADGTAKGAISARLFGREGKVMIGLLNEGSAGLQKMQQDAEELGIVLSADFAKSAEDVNDNLLRLGAAFQGALIVALKEFLPLMVKLTDEFVAFAKDGDRVAEVGKTISDTFKVLSTVGIIVGEVFDQASRAIGGFAAAAVALAQGEFSRAFEIVKEANIDTIASLEETAESLKTLWDDPVAEVEAKAPKLARQLASPVIATTDIVDKEAAKLEKRLTSLANKLRALVETPQEAFNRKLAEAKVLLDGNSITLETYTRVVAKYTDELNGATGAAEAFAKEEEFVADVLERIKTPVEKFREEIEKLNDARERGSLTSAEYTRAVELEQEALSGATKQTEELNESSKELGLTFSSALEDAIVEGKDLSEVLQGLGKDIERILFRKLVTEPFTEAISGFASNLGGGGGLGGLFGGLFGGGRAFGGPVAGGQSYLVGERGPETFTPGVPGAITPTRGGNTIINQNFTFNGPVDKRSQDQVAVAAASGAQRAIRRNT